MKCVYAMLTTRCNLSCPYCVIRDNDDNFDQDKFIYELKKFDGRIVLFGGEPTFYKDRLFRIYYDKDINNKISGITTNLIYVDDDLIRFFCDIKHVGTSWSPSRFTDDEYTKWVNNLNSLPSDVSVKILSTLTEELLLYTPDKLFDTMKEWNSDIITSGIDFEFYVGPETTPEYFKRCDEWLCNTYSNWNSNIQMVNARRKVWYFDCSGIYTLYPDGELKTGCPHRVELKVPDECYACELNGECRPCRVQCYCSRPNKFIEMINRADKGGGNNG